MDPEREPLPVIAGRIQGGLDLLVATLEEAVLASFADHEAKGYDPKDDPALMSGMVRRFVRERFKPLFPHLAEQNGNMSPVHLPFGPYPVKVMHASDSSLPQPRSATREAYYGVNDQMSFVLNVFPPDALASVEENFVEEATLVLVWDSDGPLLTVADLYRPSRLAFPGDRLSMLGHVVAEADLDIAATGEGGEATGTDDES